MHVGKPDMGKRGQLSHPREGRPPFILEHPTDIDLRKVDQLWFLDVITNGLNLLRGYGSLTYSIT